MANEGLLAKKVASFCGCDCLLLRWVPSAPLFGGAWGPVPVPLHVGAPGKPLLRVSVAWDLVCDLALRVCDIVWLFVMVRVLSGLLSSFSCPWIRAGQVTGQPLWGASFLMAYFWVLRYGGGSLGGEVIDLSVPRSLITTLQRVGAAHGPRHPVCFCQSCAVPFWSRVWFCKLFVF